MRERAAERRLDGGAAFRGVQRPGEGDEVAPVAVGLEERCGGVEVAAREGGGEGFEPARGGRGHAGILGSKNRGQAPDSQASLVQRPACIICAMSEIVFVVEEAPEGGFIARAVGESIFTEADSLAELHERARDAVRCHFDEGKAPKLIRLHYVRDEVIPA